MKEYTVTIGGLDHTLVLDEEDAKRYGVAESSSEEAQTKSATPANKARAAAEK